MIQFSERIEKTLEPHGVLSDSLNRDVLKLLLEAYCQGMRDWATKGADLNLDVATAQVVKRRGPLP
jgi:hypothetical protein